MLRGDQGGLECMPETEVAQIRSVQKNWDK